MDLRAGWSRCSTGVYKVLEGVGERRGFMGRDGSRVGAHMGEIGAGTSLERLSCITTIRNAMTSAWICRQSVGVHVESVGVHVYTSGPCTAMAAHRRCSQSRASRALIPLAYCLDRLAAIEATTATTSMVQATARCSEGWRSVDDSKTELRRRETSAANVKSLFVTVCMRGASCSFT